MFRHRGVASRFRCTAGEPRVRSGKCRRPSADLKSKGHELIHGAKTEPWGQITARLLSPLPGHEVVRDPPWIPGRV